MYSTIYWLTRLDAIRDFFQTVSIVSVLLIISIIVFCFINSEFDEFREEDEIQERKQMRERYRKKITPLIIICVVFTLANVFTPTRNEAILIYAGGKAYDYVQKDTSLQKIPFKTTEYLKLVLDKEINDLKKKEK